MSNPSQKNYDTKAPPMVSVLVSVYNGDVKIVHDALQSVVRQTYSDLEILIIDDGSGLEIKKLLETIESMDKRVVLVRNQSNIGLTKSLNKGIGLAKGKYVARMDADDISYNNRISEQVDFLEHNQKIAMVGARFSEIIGGEVVQQRLPFIETYDKILESIVRFNPFCHSSTMIRTNVLKELGGYDEKFKYAQDYDLWLRLTVNHQAENINKVLVARRMDDGISVKNEQQQRLFAIKARIKFINHYGFKIKYLIPVVCAMIAYLVGIKGQMLFRCIKRGVA